MSIFEQVLESVDEKYVIDHQQRSVKTPCENPPGNYADIIELYKSELSAIGMEVNVVGKPGYPNIIGRLRGSEGKPSFCLDGHIDTVPAGPREMWTMDPFGGEIKEGKVYGRGSLDQRGGITACIAAAKAVVESGIKLSGDLIILGHSDSETGGYHGIKWLAEKHPETVRADLGLGTEPTDLKIVTVSRGVIFLKLTTKGVTGHTGMYNDFINKLGKPVNAFSKMMKVLSAMEKVEDWMTYKPHELLGSKSGMYSLDPIIEVGGRIDLNGTGVKVNVVPHKCTAEVDIRFLPGQTPEGIISELKRLIEKLRKEDPEINVTEINPFRILHPPIQMSEDNPLTKLLKASVEYVTKKPAELSGFVAPGCGVLYLSELMPITNFGPSGFGLHAPDEYVTISSLVQCTKILAHSIVNFLL